MQVDANANKQNNNNNNKADSISPPEGSARSTEYALKQGIIQESISPWASPIVLVPKKDGSLRLCIDYRKLNSVAEPDAYPIPRADDTLGSLSGCRYFTSLDLASGFWQTAMEGSDMAKTAFTTRWACLSLVFCRWAAGMAQRRFSA